MEFASGINCCWKPQDVFDRLLRRRDGTALAGGGGHALAAAGSVAGLPPGGRLAIGIERVGGDLGHLPPPGVGAPAEVGAVARRHTGLARPPAPIAAADVTGRQLLDPPP